jgi:hypothetical protein
MPSVPEAIRPLSEWTPELEQKFSYILHMADENRMTILKQLCLQVCGNKDLSMTDSIIYLGFDQHFDCHINQGASESAEPRCSNTLSEDELTNPFNDISTFF